MTADIALQAFYDEALSIDITGASAEDLTKLQETLGLKLVTGNDISFLAKYDIMSKSRFIHDNQFLNDEVPFTCDIPERLTICHGPYGKFQLSLSEFLSLFYDSKVNEDAYLGVFE